MGILTSNEILKQRESKFIRIEPFNIKNLNPNSYDLTLFNELEVYIHSCLDPRNADTFKTKKITIPEKGYRLKAGKCYLARTNEYTYTWNYVPTLHGKSGIGRMFLDVTGKAGYGDVGYAGYWTIALCPQVDTIVYPNMKIVQIQYETVTGDVRQTYNGKYQNSEKIMPSKEYEEYKQSIKKIPKDKTIKIKLTTGKIVRIRHD